MSAGAESLRRVLGRLDGIPRTLHREMAPRVRRWGEDWVRGVQDRIGGGGPLRNRTGALRGSMKFDFVDGGKLGSIRLRCKSDGVIYARIQQFGGVIRPKNARFLTIPLDPALTSAGVARFTARQLIAANPTRTYFVRLDSGELLLVLRPDEKQRRRFKSARGNGVAMFRLVRQVELPGPKAPTKRAPSRLGFFETWRDLQPVRQASIQKAAALAVGGLF